MSKNLPNFLLVGAAKCGTSSLHRYLDQHPGIFMSRTKEPRFFSSQVNLRPLQGPGDHKVEAWYVKKHDDYVRLFEEADRFSAVGESSADTLYFYKGTIPVIKQYLGDPRIIIMLRNPVRRAFSAYQHLVRDFREDLSFEEGLSHEAHRIRNNWELIYHYKAASCYYAAVKAFMENFSSVKIILTEDQEERPQQVMQDVFRFLEVDPNYSVNTNIRYNRSGKPKSKWIHQFFRKDNVVRKLAQPLIRTLLPPETRVRLAYKIQEKNLTRMKINPQTRKFLQEYFEDDITRLESLLERDLSRWRK